MTRQSAKQLVLPTLKLDSTAANEEIEEWLLAQGILPEEIEAIHEQADELGRRYSF